MADILQGIGCGLTNLYNSLPAILPRVKEIEKVVVKEVQMIITPPTTRVFVRIAGVSGALAVALGAYGSHVFRHQEVDPKLKETFDIANKYHFLHTLALLAVPLTRKPVLTGTLMTIGITLFCGSCYFHAMTNNTVIRKVTPYGGFLLIFAWISMAL